MLESIFNYLGQLNIYGVDPDLVAMIGFCLLLFGVSEFFRLLELVLAHLTKR